MKRRRTRLAAVLSFLGGRVEGMGGNCTAIVFDYGDSETLITSVKYDHTAPESLNEMADAITYDKDKPDEIRVGQRGTLRQILLDLYDPIAGEPLPGPLACLRTRGTSR